MGEADDGHEKCQQLLGIYEMEQKALAALKEIC